MSLKENLSSASHQELVEYASDIVSAYVSNNSLPTSELPSFIAAVHTAIASLHGGQASAVPETAKPEPAVPVKKSVHKDFIVCLEDGKKFKSLRRHLATLGMTPDEYRTKWNLPKDYPMVAPSYSATRSELAKQSGLGNSRAAVPDATTELVKAEAKAGRGRPRKAAL